MNLMVLTGSLQNSTVSTPAFCMVATWLSRDVSTCPLLAVETRVADPRQLVVGQRRLDDVEVEVERRAHGEDLVLVGQLREAALGPVGGARRVAGDELDLAPADASLVVRVLEVGLHRLP